MKRLQVYFLFMFVGAAIITFASCSDDSGSSSGLITLSKYAASVQVGDILDVDVNLSNTSGVDKIEIKKTQDGRELNYNKSIPVAGTTFPFKFNQQVAAEDVKGATVYSFYAKDAAGNSLDASDLVLEVALAQIPLLLKYDWKLVSQVVKGEDMATEDLLDDVNRFNPDLTWELDWGSVLSASTLETLFSTCSWKAVMKGSVVDSLYTIKYNVFAPGVPIVTKYKVLQLANRTLKLESRQDLSFFGDYATDERVVETFEPISKTDDFTPYRNVNPDSYVNENCNPGSY